MRVQLLAHHIEWDTSAHESLGLPRKVIVIVDLDAGSINEQICDQLSDITGFCVLDYKLQGYSAEADYALQMTNDKGESQ